MGLLLFLLRVADVAITVVITVAIDTVEAEAEAATFAARIIVAAIRVGYYSMRLLQAAKV